VLSDTKLKNVKPKERGFRLADDRGLCVLVQPSGSKLFQLRYRHLNKQRIYSIGSYPDVSLAQAREMREQVRKLIAQGIDPVEHRRLSGSRIGFDPNASFETVAKEWLATWSVGKSARHVGYVERRLLADIYPIIGERSIESITAPDLVGLLKRIERRGAHDIAKRAHQTCGQIFRYAVATGRIKSNPAKDFQPSDVLISAVKKNFARIDAKEIGPLMQAIEVYTGSAMTRIAMKLMAMTFVRTSELINARWQEIDWDASRWNIPAERMKMRDPHVVPLSSQAVQQLKLLHKLTGRLELMFPGERNRKTPMSNNTILKALERMGYGGRMTGHGFRGLASTVLHEKGFDHQHIEAQLAHQSRNRVSAAYNHAKYLIQRTLMMQAWADFLEAQTKSASPEQSEPIKDEARAILLEPAMSA